MGFLDSMAAVVEHAAAKTMGFAIAGGQISSKKIMERQIRGPVAGARAEVIAGTDDERITATRALILGPFALLAKKKTTKVFILISCTNGVELVSDLDAKSMEIKARKWVGKFNSKYATS